MEVREVVLEEVAPGQTCRIGGISLIISVAAAVCQAPDKGFLCVAVSRLPDGTLGAVTAPSCQGQFVVCRTSAGPERMEVSEGERRCGSPRLCPPGLGWPLGSPKGGSFQNDQASSPTPILQVISREDL